MTRKGVEQIMRAAGAATAKMRRDHLPSRGATTSITVSLDAIELGALDVWIADQPHPKPSREEAGFPGDRCTIGPVRR
jgi:hypothetical protein